MLLRRPGQEKERFVAPRAEAQSILQQEGLAYRVACGPSTRGSREENEWEKVHTLGDQSHLRRDRLPIAL